MTHLERQMRVIQTLFDHLQDRTAGTKRYRAGEWAALEKAIWVLPTAVKKDIALLKRTLEEKVNDL